jgi:hypothetical protein
LGLRGAAHSVAGQRFWQLSGKPHLAWNQGSGVLSL